MLNHGANRPSCRNRRRRRFQRSANTANTAIHHVGWRHHINAGRGLHYCLLDQHIEGDVIEHITVIVNDAVLSMRGVRIQRDVRDNRHFRKLRFDGFNDARH